MCVAGGLLLRSGEKNALRTWKITYPSIFLPCRNILQFCSIPWVKRSNYLASSDQTTVYSPGFLAHHCGRVVSAPVLGWDEAGCPEDQDWVNRAKQNQHGEYYYQYMSSESQFSRCLNVQVFSAG